MAKRTYNRNVAYNELDWRDMRTLAGQDFYITIPTGINTSKNYSAVDQASFSDALNVYIDSDLRLRLRPIEKSLDILEGIRDIKVINNYTFYFTSNKLYVDLGDRELQELYDIEETDKLYWIIDKYILFRADTLEGFTIDNGKIKKLSYNEIVYIPEDVSDGSSIDLNSFTGNINKNVFTDTVLKKYVYLPETYESNPPDDSEYLNKHVTVDVNNKTVNVVWRKKAYKAFSHKLDTNKEVNSKDIITVASKSGKYVLQYNNNQDSPMYISSDYGNTYVEIDHSSVHDISKFDMWDQGLSACIAEDESCIFFVPNVHRFNIDYGPKKSEFADNITYINSVNETALFYFYKVKLPVTFDYSIEFYRAGPNKSDYEQSYFSVVRNFSESSYPYAFKSKYGVLNTSFGFICAANENELYYLYKKDFSSRGSGDYTDGIDISSDLYVSTNSELAFYDTKGTYGISYNNIKLNSIENAIMFVSHDADQTRYDICSAYSSYSTSSNVNYYGFILNKNSPPILKIETDTVDDNSYILAIIGTDAMKFTSNDFSDSSFSVKKNCEGFFSSICEFGTSKNKVLPGGYWFQGTFPSYNWSMLTSCFSPGLVFDSNNLLEIEDGNYIYNSGILGKDILLKKSSNTESSYNISSVFLNDYTQYKQLNSYVAFRNTAYTYENPYDSYFKDSSVNVNSWDRANPYFYSPKWNNSPYTGSIFIDYESLNLEYSTRIKLSDRAALFSTQLVIGTEIYNLFEDDEEGVIPKSITDDGYFSYIVPDEDGYYVKGLSSKATVSYYEGTEYKTFIPEFVQDITTNMYGLSVGNKLYHTVYRKDKLYIPENSVTTFEGDITNLIKLSSTSLGVFLTNAVYEYKLNESLTSDLYTPTFNVYKTKLQLGCLKGADIIYTFDGSSIIMPTTKGLAALTYQEFVQSTDQVYSFLSDNIDDKYREWTNNYKIPIKLSQHKDYIIAYKVNSNDCYVFDIRNKSWWYWNFTESIKLMIVDSNNKLTVLQENSYNYLDFEDEESYKDRGVYNIDWFFRTQPLHFGAPNNYKHVSRVSIVTNTKNKTFNYKLKFTSYRNIKNLHDIENVFFDVSPIETLIQKIHFIKTNAFEVEVRNNDFTDNQINITAIIIHYRITEDIR